MGIGIPIINLRRSDDQGNLTGIPAPLTTLQPPSCDCVTVYLLPEEVALLFLPGLTPEAGVTCVLMGDVLMAWCLARARTPVGKHWVMNEAQGRNTEGNMKVSLEPFHYMIRTLILDLTKLKTRDWVLYHLEIWHAAHKLQCQDTTQISEWLENCKHWFRAFETLRDLPIRPVILCWSSSLLSHPWLLCYVFSNYGR